MDKAEIPQKNPYVLETDEGKHAWCSCGKSKKQPFCDGSHVGSSFKPVITEIKEKKKYAWCGCKHTKTPPFCDGSHTKLD